MVAGRHQAVVIRISLRASATTEGQINFSMVVSPDKCGTTRGISVHGGLSRFDNPTNGADTISGTHFN